MSIKGELRLVTTHSTAGNVIGMIALPEFGALLYSVDMTHLSFSTKVISDEPYLKRQYTTGVLWSTLNTEPPVERSTKMANLISAFDVCAQEQRIPESRNVAKGKSLQELLYGLESLRKRGNDEANEE